MMVILFFILISASLAYILLPLAGENYWPFVSEGTLAGIQTEKKEGVQAISDIDFEFEMGKLTEEDHASTREYLKRQALPALKMERDLLDRMGLNPKQEISRKLKRDINKEVLRICGKKLSS